MKKTVRWRVVHPADKGEKISCGPYVLYEEILSGMTRGNIMSCGVEAWPAVRARIKGDEVAFEQLPDTMEPPRPEGLKKTKKARR